LKARRELLVASEGIPFLMGVAGLAVAMALFGDYRYAVLLFAVFVVLLFVFRDPIRIIPAAPLGLVSPVDGTVSSISTVSGGPLEGEAHCIRLRVNVLGAYTARSPVEGKVMELHRVAGQDSTKLASAGGLWIRTDEGVDVVLQFRGNRFGLAPRAFIQYGERVGQGERCAWLRLTRIAEIQLPAGGRVLVEEGDNVAAGSSLLARLPHR
jgi:phosphatidylserine decarboxylase